MEARGHFLSEFVPKKHAGKLQNISYCPEEENGEKEGKIDTISDDLGEVGDRHVADKQPHVRDKSEKE